jgi:hypothetical protein
MTDRSPVYDVRPSQVEDDDEDSSAQKRRKLRPVNRGAQACNECRGHKVGSGADFHESLFCGS